MVSFVGDTSYPESSPDPLASSIARRSSPRKPLRRTSHNAFGNKQPISSRTGSVLDYPSHPTSSPTKSFLIDAPKSSGNSPLKITVTVETEQLNDQENGSPISPSIKLRHQTTTTTVPLKGADESSPVKRRGRPRKSDVGIAAQPKRSGTPARKNSRSHKSDAHSIAAEFTIGTSVLEDSSIVEVPKRRRGRPRKSVSAQLSGDDTDGGPEVQSSDTNFTTKVARVRRRRKTLGAQDTLGEVPESANEPDEQSRNATSAIPVPDDVVREDQEDSEAGDGADGVQRDIYDSTTIMESEGFSMISVESLPSRQAMSSPAEALQKPSTQQIPQEKSKLFLDTSYMPSSPPLTGRSEHTPCLPILTPLEPPPLQAPPVNTQTTSAPTLARVVKAGIALQGVTDPQANEAADEPASGAAKYRLDNLFSGFGEGTRRELQAGLRLGEQLARRSQDRQSSKCNSPINSTDTSTKKHVERQYAQVSDTASRTFSNSQRLPTPDDPYCGTASKEPAETTPYRLSVPGPTARHGEVLYPSLNRRLETIGLASPQSENAMDWLEATPPLAARTVAEPAMDSTKILEPLIDTGEGISVPSPGLAHANKPISRRRTRKQASEVNDIWQEEASRSSNDSAGDSSSLAATEASPQVADLLAPNEPIQPRRGKLPRTWRRKSASDFHYSDEAEPTPEPEQIVKPFAVRTARAQPNYDRPIEAAVARYVLHPQQQTVTPDDSSSSGSERVGTPVSEGLRSPGAESDDSGMFFQNNLPAIFKRQDNRRRTQNLDLSDIMRSVETPSKSSPHRSAERFSPAKQSAPILRIPQSGDAGLGSPLKHVSFANVSTSEVSLSTSRMETEVEDWQNDSTASDVRQLRSEIGTAAARRPCFGDGEIPSTASTASPLRQILTTERAAHTYSQQSSSPATLPARSIFSRLTGTLFTSSPTIASSPSLIPRHPILTKYPPLPRTHPWTRQHYISLDNLVRSSSRSPNPYSPSVSPLNASLLSSFPEYKKYIGAEMSNWGYEVTVSEEDLVLCMVLMQTFSVRDVGEWENTMGKRIKMGDCKGGEERDGEMISEHDVLVRLFSVKVGESVREDERSGKEVRREGGLKIRYTEGC